jgi:hypothetical protein
MADQDDAAPLAEAPVAAAKPTTPRAKAKKAPAAKSAAGEGTASAAEKPAKRQRQIPGNIPYTLSPGVLKRVLEKIPVCDKPPVFNSDFLGDVMGATGGSSRPIIPILKNTQMLSQSGTPTELYAQFQTEGGRASAALQAMRHGFAEVFKRNVNAHKADEAAIADIIVAITGLTKSDRILSAMVSTFQTFQEFARGAREEAPADARHDVPLPKADAASVELGGTRPISLVYNINIVLPESTSIEVFNAIFRSLKGNLLE